MIGVTQRESRCTRFRLIAALIPLLHYSGCGRQQGTYLGGKDTLRVGNISKEQLTERLQTLADTTKELLLETSQTLGALDPEIGTRRADVVHSNHVVIPETRHGSVSREIVSET